MAVVGGLGVGAKIMQCGDNLNLAIYRTIHILYIMYTNYTRILEQKNFPNNPTLPLTCKSMGIKNF